MRQFLALAVLLLLATARAVEDWGGSAEELDGATVLTDQGIKLVLSFGKPKLTAVATAAACDGVDATACAGQFLLTGIRRVYEVDAAGAEVANRAGDDVLNLTAGSWERTSEDLSADTEPALSAVPTAMFTVPFKAANAVPACAPTASTFTSLAGERRFEFKAFLFPAATNFTVASTGETLELLRGNVKTLLTVSGWPFCSPDHQLVVEMGLKSKALGDTGAAARIPTVLTGSEAAEALAELETRLASAVGAVLEGDDGEEIAPAARRLLDSSRGNGRAGADNEGINSSARSGNGTASGSERRVKRWEAVQEVVQRAAAKANATLSKALTDKLGARRPIAGLGRRSDDRRLFLALPGAGAVDAKLDVPTVALIDGTNTTIAVTALSFNRGEGVQRLRLAFLAFSGLQYDPTSSFAATDASLDTGLQGLLASSGAAALRGALALAFAAAAAAAALLA